MWHINLENLDHLQLASRRERGNWGQLPPIRLQSGSWDYHKIVQKFSAVRGSADIIRWFCHNFLNTVDFIFWQPTIGYARVCKVPRRGICYPLVGRPSKDEKALIFRALCPLIHRPGALPPLDSAWGSAPDSHYIARTPRLLYKTLGPELWRPLSTCSAPAVQWKISL